MTGTIKLIRVLLLMVIQHGGDDVSCKRSIELHVLEAHEMTEFEGSCASERH